MPADQAAPWDPHWFNSACIDLRDAEDFVSRHIINTTSLPWGRLADAMHELPDKHQILQLLGTTAQIDQATEFLTLKGYRVTNQILATDEFWRWAETKQLLESGCHTIPLWRANPLLQRAISSIEQQTSGRKALDLACGAGRDSVFLARRGWDVTAIDIKEDALQRCQSLAESSGCMLTTRMADMESDTNQLMDESYDLIVVMRYLHRPFLPQLLNHLNPKGMLCYSTFMVGCEQFGSPRNPNYLLRPNELADTFSQMTHLINEEHQLADGRPIAWFLGQKQG